MLVTLRPGGHTVDRPTTQMSNHHQETTTMSRTVKWEHPSDPIRISYRLERQARPAGRFHGLAADALEELEDLAQDAPTLPALAAVA